MVPTPDPSLEKGGEMLLSHQDRASNPPTPNPSLEKGGEILLSHQNRVTRPKKSLQVNT